MASRCSKAKSTMKKKFIIPMIAVAAISGAVLFSAFKANSGKATEQLWFQYSGSGDPTQSENYVLSGSAAPDCGGDQQVCAIRALDNGFDQPEITSTLAAEINAAVSNNTPSANVGLRD